MAEPISRKQEKVCVKCNHIWWAWGRQQDVCWYCDPPPPPQGKAYVEKLNSDDPLVKL